MVPPTLIDEFSLSRFGREEGLFSVEGSVAAEKEKFENLVKRNAAIKELQFGTRLVQLARDGDLQKLELGVRTKKPLFWFTVQMFREAACHNQIQVLRFMSQNGLSFQYPLDEIITYVVAQAEIISQQVLWYLVYECGIPASRQRRKDCFSALHIACDQANFELVQFLVDQLGADVNAVATNDIMPIHCAQRASTSSDKDKIVAFLRERGARSHWRRDNFVQQQDDKNEPKSDIYLADDEFFSDDSHTFGTHIQG